MNNVLKHRLLAILNEYYRMLTADMQHKLNFAVTNDDINKIMKQFNEELITCNNIAEELRKEETK